MYVYMPRENLLCFTRTLIPLDLLHIFSLLFLFVICLKKKREVQNHKPAWEFVDSTM